MAGSPSIAENLQTDNQRQAPKKYYVDDIKKAMSDYINSVVDDDGIFHLYDEKTDEDLSLRFVKIHDPVRVIDGNTYFACTDFKVVGEDDKLYDLDFWLSPVDGVLKVYQTKIHKEPRKSLIYGWYKQPRYTFIDDKIVPLY
jgi:hypothetical protein